MPWPTTGVGITSYGAAAAAPQLAAGVRIVRAHATLAVDDDFVVIAGANRDRRAPADVGVCGGVRHSGRPVRVSNARDERTGRLILIEDDAVPVHERRPGGAVIRVHRAELAVPERSVPFEIDGHQAATAERYVHALAIGGRRRRGVPFFEMRRRDASLRGANVSHRRRAVGAPERQHREAPPAVGRRRQEHRDRATRSATSCPRQERRPSRRCSRSPTTHRRSCRP